MFEHIFLLVTLKLSLSRPDVHVGPSGSAAPRRTIAILQKAFHPGYSPCFRELQPDKMKCGLQLSLPAHPVCPACEEVGWFQGKGFDWNGSYPVWDLGAEGNHCNLVIEM